MDRLTLLNCVLAITRTGTRLWLNRWASLAAWLVATGTLGLAAATYWLARRAREEAQAVRAESDRLGDQARASLRAYVYVESSSDWSLGIGHFWSTWRVHFLPLRNGGPGLHLLDERRQHRPQPRAGVRDPAGGGRRRSGARGSGRASA